MGKILIVGFLGLRTNQLDGQTVKTRNISKLLKDSGYKVDNFDTENFKQSKLYIFDLLRVILTHKNIIIVPASNALTLIFPILFVLSKLFFKNVILVPVGGWLSWFLKDRKILRYMLKHIKAVMPQTQSECDNLKTLYSFENILYFPNFRLTAVSENVKTIDSKILKLVFFARINKKKGLDVVFNIADRIVKEGLSKEILIDFYGQINEPDREYFMGNIQKYDNVNYNGFISPDNINNVLSEYDLLLFPTRYINDEGFPGTILDGYMAGLPVIASNWCHSKEFVNDKKSGYICDINNIDLFYEKVLYLKNNPNVLLQLKKGALDEAHKYTGEKALEIITPLLKK